MHGAPCPRRGPRPRDVRPSAGEQGRLGRWLKTYSTGSIGEGVADLPGVEWTIRVARLLLVLACFPKHQGSAKKSCGTVVGTVGDD